MNTPIQVTTQEALDALPLGTKLQVKAPRGWFCPKGYTTTLTKRHDTVRGDIWTNTVGSKMTLRFLEEGRTHRPAGSSTVLDVGGTAYVEGPSRRRKPYANGSWPGDTTLAQFAVITIK